MSIFLEPRFSVGLRSLSLRYQHTPTPVPASQVLLKIITVESTAVPYTVRYSYCSIDGAYLARPGEPNHILESPPECGYVGSGLTPYIALPYVTRPGLDSPVKVVGIGTHLEHVLSFS